MILLDALNLRGNEVEQVALLKAVAANGLPGRPESWEAGDYAQQRELWLRSLVDFAVNHREGAVRFQAMRALQVAAPDGGVTSLREEDWDLWWQDHIASITGASGQ